MSDELNKNNKNNETKNNALDAKNTASNFFSSSRKVNADKEISKDDIYNKINDNFKQTKEEEFFNEQVNNTRKKQLDTSKVNNTRSASNEFDTSKVNNTRNSASKEFDTSKVNNTRKKISGEENVVNNSQSNNSVPKASSKSGKVIMSNNVDFNALLNNLANPNISQKNINAFYKQMEQNATELQKQMQQYQNQNFGNIPNLANLQQASKLGILPNIENLQTPNLSNIPNVGDLPTPNLSNLPNLNNLPKPDLANIANLDNLPNIENIQNIGNSQNFGDLSNLPNLDNLQIPNIEDITNGNIATPNIENLPNLGDIQMPNWGDIPNIDLQNLNNTPIQNAENTFTIPFAPPPISNYVEEDDDAPKSRPKASEEKDDKTPHSRPKASSEEHNEEDISSRPKVDAESGNITPIEIDETEDIPTLQATDDNVSLQTDVEQPSPIEGIEENEVENVPLNNLYETPATIEEIPEQQPTENVDSATFIPESEQSDIIALVDVTLTKNVLALLASQAGANVGTAVEVATDLIGNKLKRGFKLWVLLLIILGVLAGVVVCCYDDWFGKQINEEEASGLILNITPSNGKDITDMDAEYIFMPGSTIQFVDDIYIGSEKYRYYYDSQGNLKQEENSPFAFRFRFFIEFEDEPYEDEYGYEKYMNLFTLNLSASTKDSFFYDEDTDYFYYQNLIYPGEKYIPFASSITLDTSIGNDFVNRAFKIKVKYCTVVPESVDLMLSDENGMPDAPTSWIESIVFEFEDYLAKR